MGYQFRPGATISTGTVIAQDGHPSWFQSHVTEDSSKMQHHSAQEAHIAALSSLMATTLTQEQAQKVNLLEVRVPEWASQAPRDLG